MVSGALMLRGGCTSVEGGEERVSEASDTELPWSPAEGVSSAESGGVPEVMTVCVPGPPCPGRSEFGVYEAESRCKTQFF